MTIRTWIIGDKMTGCVRRELDSTLDEAIAVAIEDCSDAKSELAQNAVWEKRGNIRVAEVNGKHPLWIKQSHWGLLDDNERQAPVPKTTCLFRRFD